MSDTDDKLNAALAKIAALETEMAPLRAAAKTPAGLDPRAIAQAFARDPVGTMSRLNISKDHVTKVLVADALGDAAPPELRALAALGPQVAATNDLTTELASLRQRLDSAEADRKRQTVRDSTKNLAADKKTYPHLAAALTADPSLFDGDFDRHGGSASELADALEKRLAATAKALGVPPPASKDNADPANPASKQGTARASGTVAGDPPPISTRTSKGFSEDDRAALRDEIVRNAERGVYDVPAHPYRPE